MTASTNLLTVRLSTGLNKQRGSSLAIAIFVIIVMSLLTTAITNTISSSQDQVVQEVLGTRALLAAESANDITLAKLFPLNQADANLCSEIGFSDPELDEIYELRESFNSFSGFENCIVSTSCSHENAAGSETYYLVESTGVCKSKLANDATDETCNNLDEFCVSRTIEVEAKEL